MGFQDRERRGGQTELIGGQASAASVLSEWNPYLEEFVAHHGAGVPAPWAVANEPNDYWTRTSCDCPDHRGARSHLTAKYAFAVPNEEALSAISAHGPVVEMGAGAGYWARCLRERGVDVLAYDRCGEDWRRWFPEVARRGHMWTTVVESDVHVLRAISDRSLLLVWPNCNSSFATRALAAYAGNVVIYVGEGEGGCTADDRFHRLVGRFWEQIEEVAIPQWYGIHDWLSIYRRRESRS